MLLLMIRHAPTRRQAVRSRFDIRRQLRRRATMFRCCGAMLLPLRDAITPRYLLIDTAPMPYYASFLLRYSACAMYAALPMSSSLPRRYFSPSLSDFLHGYAPPIFRLPSLPPSFPALLIFHA